MLNILIPESKAFFQLPAAEFKKYYELVSGKTAAIITTPAETGDMVVFGSDAVNSFIHSKIISGTLPRLQLVTGSDSYQILSFSDNGRTILLLAGGCDRAYFYALYHFFELQGCRYFWDGDRLPEKHEIRLDGYDITESPRFQYRGLRYFAHRSLSRFQAEHWSLEEWKKELDWCLKKRFNLYMLRIGIDDLFQKAFPDIVKYPDWHVPESIERSYDDRDLFWSLQYRGELRKAILAYGRERGLFHPEDYGTMTHWYSRTPKDFIEAVKPDFLPQSTNWYTEPTALVWDIRQEKNLENYFHLTETHIREYGDGKIFHTIGLGERNCYPDRNSNHQLKLYTYRRLISKLREKYPDAPLLLASWDFWLLWKPEEVRELLQELDPRNTIIFDYTSETDDDANNFTTWGVVGKFPYVFGIFHAYEPSNDIRGDYSLIARRLETAAGDEMCKGMILWPECSHTDTLMLEYLGANSWNPGKENRDIETFLPKFAAARYAEKDQQAMMDIWQQFQPILKMRYFTRHTLSGELHLRPFQYVYHGITGDTNSKHLLEQEKFVNDNSAEFAAMPELFRKIAKIDFGKADNFIRRDLIDIARSTAGRLHIGAYCRFTLDYNAWRKGDLPAEKVLKDLQLIRRLYPLQLGILGTSEDYSLYASLLDLQRKHECNPDFEKTLKANVENAYCRTSACELIPLLIDEYYFIFAPYVQKLKTGEKSALVFKEIPDIMEKYTSLVDKFYATALADAAPNFAKAREELPATLEALAQLSEEFAANEAATPAEAAALFADFNL